MFGISLQPLWRTHMVGLPLSMNVATFFIPYERMVGSPRKYSGPSKPWRAEAFPSLTTSCQSESQASNQAACLLTNSYFATMKFQLAPIIVLLVARAALAQAQMEVCLYPCAEEIINANYRTSGTSFASVVGPGRRFRQGGGTLSDSRIQPFISHSGGRL